MLQEALQTDIRRGVYHPDFDPAYYDFRNFLGLVWERIGLPEPTLIQDEVAHFVQRGPEPASSPFESPNDRVMVGGYRGMGKSYITGAYAVHCLALDPTLNILVISGSEMKSFEFTQFAKRLIEEIPELGHIKPPPKERTRWSGGAFEVRGAGIQQAPSVRAASITGTITGGRADVIVCDDIETPLNSETQQNRDRIDRLVDQFPFIYKPRSRVIYLGTFQCEDSHYVKLPGRGYWMRLWPARYPGEPDTGAYCKRDAYGDLLAPTISDAIEADPLLAGKATDPLRFDEVELVKKEREVGGPSQVQLQMGLDPTTSDRLRYPIKLEDLMVMDCHQDLAPEGLVYARDRETALELPNPGLRGDFLYKPLRILGEWGKYTGSLAYIDPAGGGQDETSMFISKVRNGFIYFLDFDAFVHKPEEEDIERMVRLCRSLGVAHIRYEDNYGGGMFGNAIAPVVRRIYKTSRGDGCGLDSVTHSRVKEHRMIGSIEPMLNAHRIVLSRRLVEKDHVTTHEGRQEYKLLYQLSRLRNIKGALVHDDRLECIAGSLDYWSEEGAFDIDHREEQDRAEEEASERELHDFMLETGLEVHSEPNFLHVNRGVSLSRRT